MLLTVSTSFVVSPSRIGDIGQRRSAFCRDRVELGDQTADSRDMVLVRSAEFGAGGGLNDTRGDGQFHPVGLASQIEVPGSIDSAPNAEGAGNAIASSGLRAGDDDAVVGWETTVRKRNPRYLIVSFSTDENQIACRLFLTAIPRSAYIGRNVLARNRPASLLQFVYRMFLQFPWRGVLMRCTLSPSGWMAFSCARIPAGRGGAAFMSVMNLPAFARGIGPVSGDE